MCLGETSLTAQRPNLSICILPSLLPCLTGFPSVSQWDWLLQQNKQKNTQIYIKTPPDVPRCSHAVSQGMVFSSRRNLSCNHQPFTTDSWESFASFTCNLSSSEIYMKMLNSILNFSRKCMIWNIKGYLWSTTILDTARNEILFFSQNITYKKATEAGYHYNFLFFILFTSSAFRTINTNTNWSILGSAMLTNTGVPLVDSTPLSFIVRTENWIALPGVNLDHQPWLLRVRSYHRAEWSASSCRLIIQKGRYKVRGGSEMWIILSD